MASGISKVVIHAKEGFDWGAILLDDREASFNSKLVSKICKDFFR